MTQEHYREMYQLLDAVRLKLLRSRPKFDEKTYAEYYDVMMKNIPSAYQRFMNELNDTAGEKQILRHE